MNTIGREPRLAMIMHHPDAWAITVQPVIGGVEFQIEPFGRTDRHHVLEQLRGRIGFDAIIMRDHDLVTVRMQIDFFLSSIEYTQFHLFVGFDCDQRFLKGIRKRATIEQIIIGLAASDVVLLLRLDDQTWIVMLLDQLM